MIRYYAFDYIHKLHPLIAEHKIFYGHKEWDGSIHSAVTYRGDTIVLRDLPDETLTVLKLQGISCREVLLRHMTPVMQNYVITGHL